jgi:hypothetical protein
MHEKPSKRARTMTTYDLSVRAAVAVAARWGLPSLATDAAVNPAAPRAALDPISPLLLPEFFFLILFSGCGHATLPRGEQRGCKRKCDRLKKRGGPRAVASRRGAVNRLHRSAPGAAP